jgi:hypothetical protein
MKKIKVEFDKELENILNKKTLLIIFLGLLLSWNAHAELNYSTTCKSDKDGALNDPVKFNFKEIKKDIWMIEDTVKDDIFHFNLMPKENGKLETLVWYDQDIFSKDSGFILNYTYEINRGEIHLWILELNGAMIDKLLKVFKEKSQIEFDYAKYDMIIANKSSKEYAGFFKDCRGSIEDAIER